MPTGGQRMASVTFNALHPPVGALLYRLLRPFLFQLDAESAHGLGVRAARFGKLSSPIVRGLFRFEDERLEQTLWRVEDRPGLHFSNPVGLAAGFDKNAELVGFWPSVGFGFAEVGSVTALPNAGNPRPRAFRLPADRALINRMGLNNDGAEAVAEHLTGLIEPKGFVLGINVAKTHDPSILGDAATEDFRMSVHHLLPFAGFLALNVSCPNTSEGKTFEEPDALDALLGAVMEERAAQKSSVPVLVKFSPPASENDMGNVDELARISLEHGVEGFIATNTASGRDRLRSSKARLADIGNGGLSGRPLARRATALVRHLYRRTSGAVPIIGVGGIDSPEIAYERIRAGASLVELYTGLVYEGPALIKRINKGLVRFLERDGFGSIHEAIGTDA